MAEGFLRDHGGDRFNADIAGTEPAERVQRLAVQVMTEKGIDSSNQEPRNVGQLLGRMAVRHVIIACSASNEEFPRIFPGMMNRHFWPFDDPAAFVGIPTATFE